MGSLIFQFFSRGNTTLLLHEVSRILGYKTMDTEDSWIRTHETRGPNINRTWIFHCWGGSAFLTIPLPCCPRVYYNCIRLWTNTLGSQTQLTFLGSFYWYLDDGKCRGMGLFFFSAFLYVWLLSLGNWMVLLHGKSIMRILSLYLHVLFISLHVSWTSVSH